MAATPDLRSIEVLIAAAYEKYVIRMDRPPAPLVDDYGAAIGAGTIWVAGDPVAGLISLIQADQSLLIENVAVHPSSQGTGLGRRLMEFAEQEATRLRLKRLILYTNEVMVENLAVYNHLGYVEVERRTEDGYRRVFMEKVLPKMRGGGGIVSRPDERMVGMGAFELGGLSGVAAALRPDLLAEPTQAALTGAGWLHQVGVVEIDPALSDTASTQKEFGLQPDMLANCVVVGGKREGSERLAACVVLATTRADINGVVKRYLDVRKASFLPMERAVALTGMEYGGMTPIGLPADWPVLVDARVIAADVVVIGSGVRRSKIILPGALLGQLPSAEVLDGLAA